MSDGERSIEAAVADLLGPMDRTSSLNEIISPSPAPTESFDPLSMYGPVDPVQAAYCRPYGANVLRPNQGEAHRRGLFAPFRAARWLIDHIGRIGGIS